MTRTINLKTATDAEMRPWPKNPRYLVSRTGEVFSTWQRHRSGLVMTFAPPRPISRRINSEGYWVASVTVGARQVTQACHRMVLEAWVGPAPVGYQCAHANGKRDDCRLENLRWVSPAENMRHQLGHGTALVGQVNHNAKLTDLEALVVPLLRRCGVSTKQIAQWLGVSRDCIQSHASLKRGSHVFSLSHLVPLLKAYGVEVVE